MAKWFALYTASRAEKQVAERLKRIGAEIFLPLHKSLKTWSDRKKVIEEPLFRSYVFVRCLESDLCKMTMIKGVCNVLYYLGKPAVVRDEEIAAIKEFLKLAEKREVISMGDTVEIVNGAFFSETGTILRIEKDYVCLVLEKIGAKILVSLQDVNKK